MAYKTSWKHSLLHSCRFKWALRPHRASPFPEPVYTLSCPGSWWTSRRKELLLSDTDPEAFPSSAATCKRGLLPCLRGHTGAVCSLSIAKSWRSRKEQAQMWECHAPSHCPDPWDILLCSWMDLETAFEYLFFPFFKKQLFFVFYWIFKHSLYLIYCCIYQGQCFPTSEEL